MNFANVKTLMLRALVCASGIVTAQGASADQIQFEIAPVTTCSGAGICNPVTEYRVYTQGSTVVLASSNTTTTAPVPFQMDIGTEYCFEATAFNGIESARSSAVCYTPTAAQPDAPVIINLDVTFN